MNCDELLRRLTDFGEGALPEALCDDLRRHLEECGACAELHADLVALARVCRECPAPTLPEDLRRRLEERLGGSGSGRRE
jgi:anti-sigma factor (TIGR02949 family)